MSDIRTEKTFETAIIESLVEQGGYAQGQTTLISFFAFTATPNYKPLAVLGNLNEEGKPQPLHLYSMRQAIKEDR